MCSGLPRLSTHHCCSSTRTYLLSGGLGPPSPASTEHIHTDPCRRLRHRTAVTRPLWSGVQADGSKSSKKSALACCDAFKSGGVISDTQVTNETAAATNIDKPSYSSGVDIREVHLPMVSAEGCVTVHAEWLP